ncbi:MAG TPA: ABC transporter ATP-binding protein [Thermoanaerobaculia bacterium]|nr:ABC transporter ATP-binding protein [Thermoanaerobaculia bacterium]
MIRDAALEPTPSAVPIRDAAGDATDPGPVVELDGLSVRLGRRTILDRLSGRLAGRAIGLLGPNGAGKTTLLHTLLGFHRPSAGTARIFGRDVVGDLDEVRSMIGYMPENDAFVAHLSAVRLVRMMGEISGLPPREALERAHEALFYVGLGEARYREIGSYSSGMKQLVKLAQALVHGPRLLFLDEPTNALDPPARERMLRHIQEIRDQGEAAIILSSHLLRDVERCCDEVLVLKDGRVAAYRDLVAERRSNRKFLELELKGDDDGFLAALRRRGADCVPAPRRGRNRFKMVLPEELEVSDLYREAAERGVQIRRLSYKRDSLEEIFLAAMDNGEAASPTAEEVRDGTA